MAIRSLARSSIRQSSKVNSALTGYESNYFHHLETVRLGASASSIDFINLARYNDYQHLQIRIIGRASVAANLQIQYNDDTGALYSAHYLEANGSSVFSGASVNAIFGNCGVLVSESNIFSGMIIDILDPFDTTKNKTARSTYGAATAGSKWMGIASNLYRNTAAITSIKLIVSGTTFVAGSRFSLYGLKARA